MSATLNLNDAHGPLLVGHGPHATPYKKTGALHAKSGRSMTGKSATAREHQLRRYTASVTCD
jgi:hypothetical protein